MLGRGDGIFQSPVNYPLGTYPQSVAVADFNGDGKLDLAVSDEGGTEILRGNGWHISAGNQLRACHKLPALQIDRGRFPLFMVVDAGGFIERQNLADGEGFSAVVENDFDGRRIVENDVADAVGSRAAAWTDTHLESTLSGAPVNQLAVMEPNVPVLRLPPPAVK
jgi:hypothetical protein